MTTMSTHERSSIDDPGGVVEKITVCCSFAYVSVVAVE